MYRVNCVYCEEDVLRADCIEALDYSAMRDHIGICQRRQIDDVPFLALDEVVTNFRLRSIAAHGD